MTTKRLNTRSTTHLSLANKLALATVYFVLWSLIAPQIFLLISLGLHTTIDARSQYYAAARQISDWLADVIFSRLPDIPVLSYYFTGLAILTVVAVWIFMFTGPIGLSFLPWRIVFASIHLYYLDRAIRGDESSMSRSQNITLAMIQAAAAMPISYLFFHFVVAEPNGFEPISVAIDCAVGAFAGALTSGAATNRLAGILARKVINAPNVDQRYN